MQRTEDRKVEYKSEFATRRRNQIIVSIPLIAVMLLLVLAQDKHDVLGMPVAVVGVIAGILIIGGIAFSIYNWRCPACSKYLGKGMSPRFCSKCGVELM